MKLLRLIFRFFGQFYKREYGKYTILEKVFFPYFATKTNQKDILRINKKYIMALDSSEYIQGHLYVFNCFEPSTISMIERITQKGDYIFDIGANIGYLSLVFAESASEKGAVFAFEPEENNYKSLCQNVSLNVYKNIFPTKLAISNSKSKLKLYKSIDNNKGSHSTIFNPERLEEDFEEIDTITLDEYIESNNIKKVDLIKIDVEGAEYEVIQGMSSTLKNFTPIIIMEMNDPIQEKRGISTQNLKEMINFYGYTCFNINEDGTLQLSPDNFKHNIDNVVFVPEHKFSLIKNFIKK